MAVQPRETWGVRITHSGEQDSYMCGSEAPLRKFADEVREAASSVTPWVTLEARVDAMGNQPVTLHIKADTITAVEVWRRC